MTSVSESRYRMNIDQIQKFLPHRPPFLLIDRVLEIHPSTTADDPNFGNRIGTRVVAIKNVSFNEPHFQGHFPGFAILPGVLIVETMAQTASFSVYPYLESELDRVPGSFQCILVGVDNARFRRPVVPGDTMRVEAKVTKCRGRLWAFECMVTVDGQRVAEAEIIANLVSTQGSGEETEH